jgi:hypothetical protein
MTENDDETDLFPVEFRHEKVMKFIRDLVEGSARFISIPSDLDAKSRDSLISKQRDVISDITAYVSGKLRGDELDKLEQKIFKHLVIMKVSGILKENITQTQLEQEIEQIHLRIDSTNTLLLEIMTILKELLRRLDRE